MTVFWRVTVSLALAALILWRNLPGALLFLKPGLVKVRRGSDPRGEEEQLFLDMEEELAPLGFSRLGVHEEKPPLRRANRLFDFVNAGEATFASAFLRDGEACLYLLTAFEGGGFVLTADHARAGTEKDGRYLAGGVPGATPEQVLAAHRRRVERMKESGRVPASDLSMDGRLSAARIWFSGAGRREIRLRQANAFILCAMALAIAGTMIAAAVKLAR